MEQQNTVPVVAQASGGEPPAAPARALRSFDAFLLVAIVLVAVLAITALLRNKSSGAAGALRARVREWLAIAIVGIGIVVVGILGVVSMFVETDTGFRDKVFAGILPLLGTWVGAVIAYYFAKENFEAATDSTARLVGLEERLAAQPVTDVMIPIGQIDGLVRVKDLANFNATKIKEFAHRMLSNRVPVLDDSSRPLLIIHKSTPIEYLTQDPKLAKDGSKKLEDITFGDFENDGQQTAKDLWGKLRAFGAVGPKANLADVKRAMDDGGKDCADVFVTDNGTKSGKAVGWITNVDLGKAGRF